MNKDETDPLRGPLGVLGKFIGGAILGCFVSFVVFIACYWALDTDTFMEGKWLHALWIIPIVWGVLGIFWFKPMLELGRSIFEAYFHIDP
jgi:hypothetical protein